MKNGYITRHDGSVIHFKEVEPNKYVLTIQGKPYNIHERLMKAVTDGKVNK